MDIFEFNLGLSRMCCYKKRPDGAAYAVAGLDWSSGTGHCGTTARGRGRAWKRTENDVTHCTHRRAYECKHVSIKMDS